MTIYWCSLSLAWPGRYSVGRLFHKAFVLLAVILAIGYLCLAVQTDAAPQEEVKSDIVENCRYDDDSAAQAVWEPMRGTLPVTVAHMNGRPALRFPCKFTGESAARASWDRKANIDLFLCRGIQLKLYCADPKPVSYFSLYLQSGDGWYHGTFFPELTNGWNTLSILKHEMSIEGNPAGWDRITGLRLSAWRGQMADTEFYLSDLRMIGLLGADTGVLIVRAASVLQGREADARDIGQHAERMAQHFDALDLGCSIIDDLAITRDRITAAALIVLPHNPSLPDAAARLLIDRVRNGGKLLVFYSVPEQLRSLLHVMDGQYVKASNSIPFASIRFDEDALPGAPPIVSQKSWNIHAFRAADGGREFAQWCDAQGNSTGYPAVVGSTNGLVMTHVLLPDNLEQKRDLLLALAGYLVPNLWQQTLAADIARLGAIGGCQSFDDAVAHITKADGSTQRAGSLLQEARQLRDSALHSADQRLYPQARAQAAAAAQRLLEAYGRVQTALPGEFRAFWCHSAFGLEGASWDDAVHRLAENGFTAIFPNMLWGGAAFYPSRILPVAQPVDSRGDQIAQCLAACRKYGLQMHVWKVNWNLGHAAPKDFVETLRRQHRLQADVQGKEELWLCPSHPVNQELEINSMVEIARRYAVDGLHFDYIRYPSADYCFCSGCRSRFQRALKKTIPQWPQDVLADGRLRATWLDWRRRNITAVVKAVSQKARAVNPNIKISAAVFSNWSTDRDSVGQDWKLWCDRGYVDFVCPMDYTSSNRRFENMAVQQLRWAGQTPCYPGIGASASTSRFGPDQVIDQILITRRLDTRGFIIFNYGISESQDLLPLLGSGITQPTAKP
jgi:uncharacterized lipoprotein YddW (UPF0748 family)